MCPSRSPAPRRTPHPHCCICSGDFNAKRMTLNAMTPPPKKPKAARPDFADAHKACRTPAEHEQLALVLNARWTSAELSEFARLHYFKNGRDYPTPSSYRRAITDLAAHYRGLQYPG